VELIEIRNGHRELGRTAIPAASVSPVPSSQPCPCRRNPAMTKVALLAGSDRPQSEEVPMAFLLGVF
jgi:hypothetical protein